MLARCVLANPGHAGGASPALESGQPDGHGFGLSPQSVGTFEVEIVDDVDQNERCSWYRYSDGSKRRTTHRAVPLSISRTSDDLGTAFVLAKLMAKYGKAAGKRVKSAMHRKKKGTLKSGSGRKVKSRKQAIAIGLSEARKKGAKVPRRKSSRSRKKR